MNVALISDPTKPKDSNKIVAQVNGDDTNEVSLRTHLTESSFMILVYPIWKEAYNKETCVTIEMESTDSLPISKKDTLDYSRGWEKLVEAFKHQAEITDKEESQRLLSELDYPDEFAGCYRLGEKTEAEPNPRQLLEHGYRFICTVNVTDIAMKEAVRIDELNGFEIANHPTLSLDKEGHVTTLPGSRSIIVLRKVERTNDSPFSFVISSAAYRPESEA